MSVSGEGETSGMTEVLNASRGEGRYVGLAIINSTNQKPQLLVIVALNHPRHTFKSSI